MLDSPKQDNIGIIHIEINHPTATHSRENSKNNYELSLFAHHKWDRRNPLKYSIFTVALVF